MLLRIRIGALRQRRFGNGQYWIKGNARSLQEGGEGGVGMKRTELGKKRDPLQNAGMFRVSAIEPAKGLLLFAKRYVNGGDRWSRHVARFRLLHQLIENFSGLGGLAH